MRAVLLLVVTLGLAAPAMAQDRYGPAPVGNRGRTDALPPGMRTLHWAGKTRPAAPAPPPEAALPQPLADGALRRTSTAPVGDAPWRNLGAQTQSSAPAPVAGPAAAAEPQARPSVPVASNGPLMPAAPAQAQPVQQAQAQSATPDYRTEDGPPPARSQGDQARYYSLHREYGQTPDPVAIPEKTQVFLAGGPLGPDLDDQAAEDADTGQTAAARKAQLAADWRAAGDGGASQRVQIIRP